MWMKSDYDDFDIGNPGKPQLDGMLPCAEHDDDDDDGDDVDDDVDDDDDDGDDNQ